MMGIFSNSLGRPITFAEIHHDYHAWLCEIVQANNQREQYYNLLDTLGGIPFRYSMEMDSNRCADGLDLRTQYIDETGFLTLYNETGPCTVLEVMIGLAVRMNGITTEHGDETADRFWELVSNLGLLYLTDEEFYPEHGQEVTEDLVDIMLDRTFPRNGKGSLFPLRKSRKDQRKAELWYQMNTYLIENYYVDDCEAC